MTDRPKVQLSLLSTGVPGLDDVLGGGLPEYSFNLLAGAPGSGKTTLVHQLVFANATAERPALYFTVLGEPSPSRCSGTSSRWGSSTRRRSGARSSSSI